MSKVAMGVNLDVLIAALPAGPVAHILAPGVNMEARPVGGDDTPPGFPIALSVLRI